MDAHQDTPPFIWGDRYDLAGLALGVAALAILLLVGAKAWVAIVLGALTMNLAAYLLRRRAGVPQILIWQRLARRRRGQRAG